MLPAIWFIFSRAQCDTAARQMQQFGLQLLKAPQRAIIQREVVLLRCTCQAGSCPAPPASCSPAASWGMHHGWAMQACSCWLRTRPPTSWHAATRSAGHRLQASSNYTRQQNWPGNGLSPLLTLCGWHQAGAAGGGQGVPGAGSVCGHCLAPCRVPSRLEVPDRAPVPAGCAPAAPPARIAVISLLACADACPIPWPMRSCAGQAC